ncbi:MAG: hypothetical protein ACO1OB_12490 [Archangium sp.]
MKSVFESLKSRESFDRSEAGMSWLTTAVVSGGVGAALMMGLCWLGFHRIIPVYAMGGAAVAMLFVATRMHVVMTCAFIAAATGLVVLDPPLPFGSSTAYVLAFGVALAMEQQRWYSRVLAVAGPLVGSWWALLIMQTLSARHLLELRTLVNFVPLSFGVFVGLGAWLAKLTVAADEVEPMLAESPRALAAWDRVRSAVKKIPVGAARVELLRVMHEGVCKLVEAQRAHSELSKNHDTELEQSTMDAIAALNGRIAEETDVELKKHLEQTLRVHKDVLEQLSGMQRKTERAAARLSAELGWLETAAFSVELAPRNADGLQSLAGRLASLRPQPV